MKRTLFTIILTITLCIAFSSPSHAASRWRLGSMEGKSVAITPNHGIALTVIKPKNGIWGHFIIPLTPEQTEKLKKYRINPHFSFVPAYITIDKIERRSTGKVNEYEHFISVEVDQRQWAGLKKGSTLIIELPDGTILKENLRGSMTVMKKVERRL